MLFRKQIDRACSYCRHGVALCDGQVLCVKKGIKKPEESCRRFRYDPFKRIPVKAKAMDFTQYDDMDYSL